MAFGAREGHVQAVRVGHKGTHSRDRCRQDNDGLLKALHTSTQVCIRMVQENDYSSKHARFYFQEAEEHV